MLGWVSGEVCGREGCVGELSEHEYDGGCTCFINPPCSTCTTDRTYCPECDWHAENEPPEEFNYFFWYDKPKPYVPRRLNPLTVDYHIERGYNVEVLKGVYPPGMNSKELVEQLKGPFGGSLESFGQGKFVYRKYID